ncbi:hypothetical protein ABZ565_09750 [Streptomyces sp. NPDC016469]|uniref:hypothetical protein n=1 Tax=Streptomyces sp. NPDC016469 TaxID=3157191 RepID=UPI0033D74078
MTEKLGRHPDGSRETGPAAVAMVPGVVDGFITTTTDADGNLSLQIRIRATATGGDDHIEVILGPEHIESLGLLLLAGQGRAAAEGATPRGHVPVVPCSVGVRPRNPVVDRARWRRAQSPA